MTVCWVILRGQQINTVIQAVHSLLYIVAKCHFFSVVTWKDIIKYLQKGGVLISVRDCRWRNKTHGKIDEAVDDLESDTLMVLLTDIYFEGKHTHTHTHTHTHRFVDMVMPWQWQNATLSSKGKWDIKVHFMWMLRPQFHSSAPIRIPQSLLWCRPHF